MRFFLIPIMSAFILLASSMEPAYAITEAGRLQVGRYNLKYSSELPIIDVLEILPNQKFRFIDSGTQKEVFFFEGTMGAIQKSADGSHEIIELRVERDGRLLDGKIISRNKSEFNLRLRHMTLQIYKSFFYTEIVMNRTHSYRNNDFTVQIRWAGAKGPGPISHYEFIGQPIDY